ncbi:hypothetical protein GLOTRDRAFT_70822 [Gloeophyllum trabeum ATCC 11539]|uniref:RING-type E3 ubiquitin transferase (cysteine targeting) n=1 Tax=Gloeophyllum trabeum (strain ATCC 11539 / FP-39264 / Madison 617) TaxID=670483 RepID=S7RWY6_GLOTA|nr:uncharacterized protein GLOTRDRAFT_70822 [Gloeophyllum trabeum ATCC 11539]EPQ59405.1 hypothetical protein GLOTRDRAFT_70822 [Gloeophyllum trabeum ATCC 11539]
MSTSGLRSTWEEAWAEAQTKFQAAREALTVANPPAPRVLRVGQLDAELLDQELLHVLQEPLNRALALFNSSLKARFEPELALIIQLTLYKLSIWSDGASYGAKLQNLRYQVPTAGGSSVTSSGLPHRTLLMHGTLTVLVPYLHTRLRSHALSRAWPDAPVRDRRRRIWDYLTRMESLHSLLGLLNFILFLKDGRYRTLADRLLRMELVPSQRLTRRNVSYEFMNRQMVWHAFTEFLLFLLPLINVRAFRRRVMRVASRISISSIIPSPARSALGLPNEKDEDYNKIRRKPTGKFHALGADQCAICAENASFSLATGDSAGSFLSASANIIATTSAASEQDQQDEGGAPMYPIHTPYITSCSHVYCYFCLAERMIRAADSGEVWECLRCGEPVRSVDRLTAGSDEDGQESGLDDYEFSDFGSTDLSASGSMGSYSESGMSDHA